MALAGGVSVKSFIAGKGIELSGMSEAELLADIAAMQEEIEAEGIDPEELEKAEEDLDELDMSDEARQARREAKQRQELPSLINDLYEGGVVAKENASAKLRMMARGKPVSRQMLARAKAIPALAKVPQKRERAFPLAYAC